MQKFESLEDWIEKKWGTQGSLAEKIGMAQNTVSAWLSGRSRLKPAIQEKLRALGYDGPFPEGRTELNQDDLQGLGRDLLRSLNYVHEDLKRDNQAVGAVLQEILRRLVRLEEKLGDKN